MSNPIPLFGSLTSYIISLPECKGRREALVSNGLTTEFVERYFKATDLRNLNNEEVISEFVASDFEAHYGFKMSNAQVGCAISHREVARSISTRAESLALVLEDDVVPVNEDFAALVEDISEVFQEHARAGASFIVHLGVTPHWHQRVLHRPVTTSYADSSAPKLFLHSDPAIGLWYAHAYLLSNAAASRIAEREDMLISNVDDWLYRRQVGLIDQIFYTQPLIFMQNSTLESSIEADREGTSPKEVLRGERHISARFNKPLKEFSSTIARRVYYSFYKMISAIPYRLSTK